MSTIKIMTGLDVATSRHILTWFARQDEATQIQIMLRKHSEHQLLQNRFSQHSIPAVELAALVLASNIQAGLMSKPITAARASANPQQST